MISMRSLVEGMRELGVRSKSITSRDMKSQIDLHLRSNFRKVDRECPECGSDLPLIRVCPYCGQKFSYYRRKNYIRPHRGYGNDVIADLTLILHKKCNYTYGKWMVSFRCKRSNKVVIRAFPRPVSLRLEFPILSKYIRHGRLLGLKDFKCKAVVGGHMYPAYLGMFRAHGDKITDLHLEMIDSVIERTLEMKLTDRSYRQ